MKEQTLNIKDISKYYGNKGNLTKALDGISFKIEKGEFVGIMGASGSGKSTLLNCISTMDTVTSGNVFIDDTDITKLKGSKLESYRREKIGFMFQHYNLLDTLTAYENISLALSISEVKVESIKKIIKEISEKLKIEKILNKFPYEMSGGQQQRVAAARAIATKPSLILADEPTGALDSNSSKDLLELLSELNNEMSATILMVTHDAYSASFCDRILFLKDGLIFNELNRGKVTKNEFFSKILEVVSIMGER